MPTDERNPHPVEKSPLTLEEAIGKMKEDGRHPSEIHDGLWHAIDILSRVDSVAATVRDIAGLIPSGPTQPEESPSLYNICIAYRDGWRACVDKIAERLGVDLGEELPLAADECPTPEEAAILDAIRDGRVDPVVRETLRGMAEEAEGEIPSGVRVFAVTPPVQGAYLVDENEAEAWISAAEYEGMDSAYDDQGDPVGWGELRDTLTKMGYSGRWVMLHD